MRYKRVNKRIIIRNAIKKSLNLVKLKNVHVYQIKTHKRDDNRARFDLKTVKLSLR
jgi:hypothetical protein